MEWSERWTDFFGGRNKSYIAKEDGNPLKIRPAEVWRFSLLSLVG